MEEIGLIDQRHRRTAVLYLANDLAMVVAAFLAAWYLRFELQYVPIEGDVPAFSPYTRLLPVMLLVWPTVFYFHGLYQPRRLLSRVDETVALTIAVLLGTTFLVAGTALYRPEVAGTPFTFSRVFLGTFFATNLVMTATGRFMLRSLLRWVRVRGHNIQRILVVGAGKLGKEITQKLLGHRELGLEVVGFLDDDLGKAKGEYFGVPVIGTLDDVSGVIERQRIDQVMIALPLDAWKKTQRVLEQAGNECVDVKVVPDVFQYATLRASLEELDGTPVINLSQVPLQGFRGLAKRGIDVALSGVLMLLLLPLLPFVAALIWLEDHGPVFYRQERMGLDGRPFMMLKLRSMRVNAESTTGPVWAVRDDPRRTRFGAFLRRTSLDELPQLWNVFLGEMSLVGPRPERPTFVSEFRQEIPNYMVRHRVKAGITGWAQVHGWRGNTSIKKRLQYDLYYIQNWTLGLDLKIMWMTLRHAMQHRNAY